MCKLLAGGMGIIVIALTLSACKPGVYMDLRPTNQTKASNVNSAKAPYKQPEVSQAPLIAS